MPRSVVISVTGTAIMKVPSSLQDAPVLQHRCVPAPGEALSGKAMSSAELSENSPISRMGAYRKP